MKLLILSATTGGGHMRAANALKTYTLQQDKTAEVEIVDTLECVSPLLNKTVTKGYLYLATKTPKVYGVMYNASNKDTAVNTVVEEVNSQVSKKLIPLIKKFNPDAVVTTHSFAANMASNLKEDGHLNAPIFCIMTDFSVHINYLHPKIDEYIVSNDSMVSECIKLGINRKYIHAVGIPINEAFFKDFDKNKLLKNEQLNPDIPTILIMAGSFGVTDILKIYHNIVKIPLDFQIIVITGKNRKLYEAFDRQLYKLQMSASTLYVHNRKKLAQYKQTVPKRNKRIKPSKPTKLMYFTNEVEKYMHMSDLIITKPGGLTVSEAICCGLPMAIFNAIPGQEEDNAKFLITNNMAVRLGKGKLCTETIEDLLTNPSKLYNMKMSCQSFRKGNSAKLIYELIEDKLNNL